MKEIKAKNGEIILVDDDDFELLSKYNWRMNGKGRNTRYACANIIKGEKAVIMHRFIMKPEKNVFIDHINGNGLDNRKENLRLCTNQQNQGNQKISKKNTSGYRGVSKLITRYKSKKYVYWRAEIVKNGKQIRIGSFKNIKDAARAFNAEAIKHFGEFAKLNIIN